MRERGTCVCGNPSYLASGTCRRCYDQRRNSDPAARERKLNWWLKKYFNLSRDTYDALLLAQNGVCAVCQRPDPRGVRLAVDHDHACCPGEKSCGKCIRGLLCVNCNRATGLLGDSVANTTRLLDYLARVRVV